MNKIKLIIVTMLSALGLGLFYTPALVQVGAQAANNINCGIDGNLNKDCDIAVTDDGTLTRTVQGVIRLFQVIVGLIAVFMIIFGGLKYITSGGNDNSVKGAKNTLLYAVIGLVIVLIAEGIVRFVLNRFQ